ncbi:hypothetical protein [Erysipelothrix aquatica]|uniref:hypothetical protein n=1 Tax=Erysipelothrix aquatica TaxID=2683714 RepID=UPI0013594E83|nr:hypothetical protein [Erysipelothrix aquatica]
MNKQVRQHKQFRLKKKYIDMLEEIVEYQNNLPEFKESGAIRNDRAVIEDAIEYYHAYVMGGDMFDSLIPEVVEDIAKNINENLSDFLDTLEPALQNQLEIQSLNKEMLGVALRQMGFEITNIDEEELHAQSKENEIVFFEFEQALNKKKKMN